MFYAVLPSVVSCVLHGLPKVSIWDSDTQRLPVPVLPPDECPAVAGHRAADCEWVELHHRVAGCDLEQWVSQVTIITA